MEDDFISLDKGYVIRHWLRELHCTEGELFAAVHAVGADPRQVARFLESIPRDQRDKLDDLFASGAIHMRLA